jgi:hypothetical protein
MPLDFGQDEAAARGALNPGVNFNLPPVSREALQARDAAARSGMGTFSYVDQNGQPVTLTGDQFRMSTDPFVTQQRQQMLQGGRSDPNLLFGGESGRTQTPEEQQYRHDYHNFMRNPNSGVDHNEALRAAGLFALAPIAGYAFGPGAGAGAAAAPAGASAAAPVTAAPVAAGGGAAAAAPVVAGGGGAAAAGAGAAAALPEIVVTGTLPAATGGVGAATAAGAGAGAGAAAANSGGGEGGWQKYMKNVGSFLQSNGEEKEKALEQLAVQAPPPSIGIGQNLTGQQYAELLKRPQVPPVMAV